MSLVNVNSVSRGGGVYNLPKFHQYLMRQNCSLGCREYIFSHVKHDEEKIFILKKYNIVKLS